MLYVWVLLYVAANYIRPGEIMPALAEVPILPILSAGALIAAILSLLTGPRRFWDRPQDKLLLAYYFAIVVSNPIHGWIGGGLLGLTTFFPVVFGYFLIRVGVRTEKQVNGFVRLFVWLNVFLAFNGLMQLIYGVGLGQVEAMEVGEGVRIQGTGIFNDPNDLGMTLVMAIPFVLTMVVGHGRRVVTRVVSALLTGTLLAACFYTNSRGTMLGLGVVLTWFIYRRYGKTAAIIVGVVGFTAVFALGPSRMSDMSSDEESAQGRIQSWSEGLQMFKEAPLLGVGFRQYDEYSPLVAHNVFVHVLAELGFIGAVVFVGMFFWHFMTIRSLRLDLLQRPRLPDDLASSTVGLLTCACFLSRQYVIVPFIPLALSGCLAAAAGTDPAREGQVGVQAAWVVGLTIVLIAVFYVLVRLLASFS